MTKEQWDSKIIENGGEFLQSWNWGEFQELLGKKVIRFFDENLGLAQIIVTKLPLGLSWAYAPRGPVFFDLKKSGDLINKIVAVVPRNCVFIDFEPCQSNIEIKLPKFKSRQPEKTLILDLTQKEESFLNKMHPKTRYGIRLAEKKNLKLEEIGYGEFYKVLKKTSLRQNFRIYPEEYFRKSAEFGNSKFFAVMNGAEAIASGFFYSFDDTVYYLHGGSDYEHRALMAPHFLHWSAIKYFKAKGFKKYDFWGIDENRWPGVTRFKARFGGEIKEYPGAYVKILKPFWFKVYKAAKHK